MFSAGSTGSVAGVYMADPGKRTRSAAVTGWRLWASYIGSFQRVDSNKGYSGYDTDAYSKATERSGFVRAEYKF